MEKEFVPYELALKLKELGFNEYCLAFYWTDTTQLVCDNDFTGKHSGVHLQAPLWQQAFDWLETKHKLYHIIDNVVLSFGITDCRNNNIIITKYINHDDLYESNVEVKVECLKMLIEMVSVN